VLVQIATLHKEDFDTDSKFRKTAMENWIALQPLAEHVPKTSLDMLGMLIRCKSNDEAVSNLWVKVLGGTKQQQQQDGLTQFTFNNSHMSVFVSNDDGVEGVIGIAVSRDSYDALMLGNHVNNNNVSWMSQFVPIDKPRAKL
jgi:hypothetical protein